jgi:putative Holliday junction resolvase
MLKNSHVFSKKHHIEKKNFSKFGREIRKFVQNFCLNQDFVKIKKISKINPANPENLDKIVIRTKTQKKIIPLHLRFMGRILAIDYGKKRVGIAVTDQLQIIANGLITIGVEEIFTFLKTYTQREKVELFLVGKPKQMNYTDSSACEYIEPFVEKLEKEFTDIPIKRIDERFTSKMAFQTMIDAGLNRKKRQNKALIDTISATIMLQSYLESREYLLTKEKNI